MEDSTPTVSIDCQQTHGSLTKTVSVSENIERRELYQKVADVYSLPVSEILFCTVNSHKVDMDKLIGGEFMPEDILYFHVKGNNKEVTLTKSNESLGITITDNGADCTFIKRLKENGICAKHPSIKIGDHIEQIDKQSLVGMEHYEVTAVLKEIPIRSTFKMYLVEPKQEALRILLSFEQSNSKAQVPVPSDSTEEWSFDCQLAHGSLTKTLLISEESFQGTNYMYKLHQIISDFYSLPVSEILFCTVNSHKVDMDKLIGGQLMPEDILYFHVKGKTKEVTLTKSEESLGVTVTDNAAGYTFIKRIKENGIFAKHPSIKIGDHIEQIDKQSLVGMTHFEVTEVLKEIPIRSTFKMYLVEPKQETPSRTSFEQRYSKAQVPVPSVDLTGDKSCNACQVNEITNPAVVYCKACREFYCSSCRDCHRAFKFTRGHVLVTLSPRHVNDSDLQEEESISDCQ